jgi:hypothetical protein
MRSAVAASSAPRPPRNAHATTSSPRRCGVVVPSNTDGTLPDADVGVLALAQEELEETLRLLERDRNIS